jgi:Mg-chelatase subunit ChlD
MKTVHNLIILDESGSMGVIRSATVAGFNALVASIRESQDTHPDQRHFVSLTLFNGNGLRKLIQREPVSALRPLNEQSYQPDSVTPLYDAIGFACLNLEKAIDGEPDTWCVVHVLTDGLENASVEFTGQAVSSLIDRLREGNWTFNYIGANHDVFAAARDLGISNSLVFQHSSEGATHMWDMLCESSKAFSQRLSQRNMPDEELKRKFFNPFPLRGDNEDAS